MTIIIPRPAHAKLDGLFSDMLNGAIGTPPDRLFHYTSPAGLVGIISTGEIFATNAFFTNDVEEIRLSLSMVRNVVTERSRYWSSKSAMPQVRALERLAFSLDRALAKTA